MERELQKQHWCDKVLKTINPKGHPGKKGFRPDGVIVEEADTHSHSINHSKSKTMNIGDNEIGHLTSINFAADLQRNVMSPGKEAFRQGDVTNQILSPKSQVGAEQARAARRSGQGSSDYTTVYMPNG